MCIIITTNVHYFGVIRIDQDNLRLIDGHSQTFIADNKFCFWSTILVLKEEEIISISTSVLTIIQNK